MLERSFGRRAGDAPALLNPRELGHVRRAGTSKHPMAYLLDSRRLALPLLALGIENCLY